MRAIALLILVLAACSTAPRAPLVDLSSPGWVVRQGQAVWKPDARKPEITGDIVHSTHPSGASSILFSKTLPIVSGRIDPGGWEIEFPPENKRYSGGGAPPKRISWLQLLRAIEGQQLPERWNLIRPSTNFVGLENPESGERLEVHFQ